MSRCSRYGRHPKGKPPVIGQRDVEIFQLLERFALLRSGHLRAFFPDADKSRFLLRLGRLYHEARYINRLDSIARYRISREMQSVYQIDVLGRQELRQRGLLTDDFLLGALSETGSFHHSLMVCDVLADIDCAGRQLGIQFIPWKPRKIDVGTAGSVTPDAIFTLKYADATHRHFCLEADRGTEPIYRASLKQTSIYRKYIQYRALLSEPSVLGIKAPLFVLFVTVGEPRLENMREQLRSMVSEGRSHFLFKAMKGNGVAAPPADGAMLTEPYMRAAYPPFKIDAP